MLVAEVFEVGWAGGLKYSDGFTRPIPAILALARMGASIGCLSLALKALPVGTAYAVWTASALRGPPRTG